MKDTTTIDVKRLSEATPAWPADSADSSPTEPPDTSQDEYKLDKRSLRARSIGKMAVFTAMSASVCAAQSPPEDSTSTIEMVELCGCHYGSREQEWSNMLKGIDDLSSLSEGWNGYDANVPTDLAARNARHFVEVMQYRSCPPARIAPSAVGGIGITRRRGHRKAYVEFFNDGFINALFADDAIRVMHTKSVCPSPEDFEDLIQDIEEYLYE